jgi:hypothetical protein
LGTFKEARGGDERGRAHVKSKAAGTTDGHERGDVRLEVLGGTPYMNRVILTLGCILLIWPSRVGRMVQPAARATARRSPR